jgi:Ca2+-binding RTX toxin-like protein
MTSTVYTTSQTSGFSFANPDITVTVAVGVTISDIANDAAFSDDVNSVLINYGSLLASALGAAGVLFDINATGGSIFNAAGAAIAGDYGVKIDGDDDNLTNDGAIDGVNGGVIIAPPSDNPYVLNHGYIHGGSAGIADLSSFGGGLIYNTGVIDSDGSGISVFTNAALPEFKIVNTGTIQGATFAIDAAAGGFTLINEGTLVGGIRADLAAAVDVIVNSGKIKGDVHLGGGNDSFNGVGGTSGTIFGEDGNDHLTGGTAGDKMDGGAGNDMLTGGAGADRFAFSTSLNATTNVDRIADFKHGVDKFELDHAIFAAAGVAGTPLTAAAFFRGAHAHDAGDRIIYNPLNGFVYYDANGSGAGHEVHFATLAHGLALSQIDFLIV